MVVVVSRSDAQKAGPWRQSPGMTVRFRFRVDLQTGVGPPIGPKVVPFWDYLIEF